jgi:hypothetical protein
MNIPSFLFFNVMRKAKNFVVAVIILDLSLTLSATLSSHGSTRWSIEKLFLIKVLNTGVLGWKT